MDMTTPQMSVATVDGPVPPAASCGCSNGTACAAPAPFGGDEELHTLAKQISTLSPDRAQMLRDFLIQKTAG